MRIMVWGGGFSNKGAEAMVTTAIEELRSRLPEAEVVMWALREGEAAAVEALGAIPVHAPTFGSKREKLMWTLRSAVARGNAKGVLKADLAALWRAESEAWMLLETLPLDGIIDVSGFAYGDAWGVEPVEQIERFSLSANDQHVPVVFAPQAWGTFERAEVRAAVTGLISRPLTKYYARDARSAQYLEEAMSMPVGSIAPRADIAFGFNGGNREMGLECLRRLGCTLARPVVAITPNMRVYEMATGRGEGNSYVRALVELVRHCVDVCAVDVFLVPFECELEDSGNDDRYLCRLIAAAAKRDSRCFAQLEHLSAKEAFAMVGASDFLVGSRFHSLVFALAQGVPCMAVGWSHKYQELLGSFGLGAGVKSGDAIDAESLIAAFGVAWPVRISERERIVAVAAAYREDVGHLFDEATSFLQAHGESGTAGRSADPRLAAAHRHESISAEER